MSDTTRKTTSSNCPTCGRRTTKKFRQTPAGQNSRVTWQPKDGASWRTWRNEVRLTLAQFVEAIKDVTGHKVTSSRICEIEKAVVHGRPTGPSQDLFEAMVKTREAVDKIAKELAAQAA